MRWKLLSIIPSWWCRAASRENSAKMHSSIRSRHVGAFNRNGPTGTANCVDRPRPKPADLILPPNTARRHHRGRIMWIAGDAGRKIFANFSVFFDRVDRLGGQCLKSRRESGYHVPRNEFQTRRDLESRSRRKNKCHPHCSSSKKAFGAVEAVCSSSQSATRKNFQFARDALGALASTIGLLVKSRSAMRYPANIRA
jgi:hypothetical protein